MYVVLLSSADIPNCSIVFILFIYYYYLLFFIYLIFLKFVGYRRQNSYFLHLYLTMSKHCGFLNMLCVCCDLVIVLYFSTSIVKRPLSVMLSLLSLFFSTFEIFVFYWTAII